MRRAHACHTHRRPSPPRHPHARAHAKTKNHNQTRVRELSPPGDLASAALKPLPFEFRRVEMQYDSYRGAAVRCRYLLRVRVTGKGMVADTKREVPFWVRNYDAAPGAEAPLIKVRDEESGGAAAVWCVARAC